jgi:hypothetical protein
MVRGTPEWLDLFGGERIRWIKLVNSNQSLIPFRHSLGIVMARHLFCFTGIECLVAGRAGLSVASQIAGRALPRRRGCQPITDAWRIGVWDLWSLDG